MKTYSYLALGDSYTIGEQVRINESFPYQTVYKLRQRGLNFSAPEIVATTGFTTDELTDAINKATLSEQYDVVSLLIGVNNQYRGRNIENFWDEFERLLQRAISFAGRENERVFVLSIPDWGATPFAEGRDRDVISDEIDAFNEVCKKICEGYDVKYIDITMSQRTDADNADFLASDGLHPSEKEYEKWAFSLSFEIIETMHKFK